MKLIGFAGRAYAGKSTAAKLALEKSFARSSRIALADPLKVMLMALLKDAGVTPARCGEYLYGQSKDAPIPELGMVSARRLMQTLGTEWGRGQFGGRFWVDIAISKAMKLRAEGCELVVIDDVRFLSEVAAIRQIGGCIVKIERRDAKPVEDHASEKDIEHIQADRTILNNASLAHLEEQVRHAIEAAGIV